MTLSKMYEPAQVEGKWYTFWQERGYFRPEQAGRKRKRRFETGTEVETETEGGRGRSLSDSSVSARSLSDGSVFSMVIPPPNITGSLHMGHALNNTLQDILCRYKRMDGYRVLWVPGTDHAGIATQNVVERLLLEEGTDRWQVKREKFVERVWAWREESGRTIVNQLKRLGSSCDWSRERFTLDAGLSRAVREAFVRLYGEGLIYKGRYLINWCPCCWTALSDLEVEQQEADGHLYHLVYPRADGQGAVTIATTRPETMLGDTAVAVSPEDERYRDLVGKTLILPVLARPIPVIADTHVDKDFGTGALKVTPAHDFTDFEIGQQHGLEMISVMDEQARMTKEAGPYEGLDRYECRQKLVEDLQHSGVLIRTEPYRLLLGHCYRCRTAVEPLLSSQWFVRVKPLAEVAMAAVKEGRTQFFPVHWEKTYFAWMENIRDWCISRQLWWGHRIPAWYCDACGTMLVSREDLTTCTQCGSARLRQDTDVLDTWFSSGLWPFSTLGWPEITEDLKTFYPTSTLVTGFDIIFFWVARMMMLGLKFMGDVPFRHVYIHALVRDERGQKMSKSKGNIIDPLEVMDTYGTDALRFALAALSAMGRDIRLSGERLTGYRNFVNKVWNAARFVLMNLESQRSAVSGQGPVPDTRHPTPDTQDEWQEELGLAERWILSRLAKTTQGVRAALDEYRFNEAAALLYQFTWHEFCDWYVEASKIALEGGEGAAKENTRRVLATVLNTLLHLLHPFVPFLTEEIWQALRTTEKRGSEESLMLAPYPTFRAEWVDEEAERQMGLFMDMVRAIRNIRSEMNLPPNRELSTIVVPSDDTAEREIRSHETYIRRLGRVSDVHYQRDGERPRGAATAVINGAEIYVPLLGLIDLQEESKRLEREIAKVSNDLTGVQKKLTDARFVERAPEEIVEKEREKAAQLEEKRQTLERSLERLRQLT